MRQFLFLVIVVVLFTGCAKVGQLQHLDELLTLKGYSDEKEAQQKWVQEENERFERLSAAVKDGSIQSYTGRDAILKDFGSPVVSDMIEEKGQSLDRWLYRHPIQKLATDRVYLYFDPDGRLVKFEHIPSSSDGQ